MGSEMCIRDSLNTFLKEENINKITALKIDVEGNEEKVLVPFLKAENQKLFPKIIIIERNDNLWDSDLIKTLNNFNYSIHKKTKMNYILIND